jgi:hypothetical protein
MEDNNDTLVSPRTLFVVIQKLRRGLKNCLSDIMQMLEVADKRINDNFEFDMTLQYAEYLTRKHIHDTIAPKDKDSSSSHKSRNVTKLQALKMEMDKLIEERKLRLINIDKIADQSFYFKTYMDNNPSIGEFDAVHEKLTEILDLYPDISDRNNIPYNSKMTEKIKY